MLRARGDLARCAASVDFRQDVADAARTGSLALGCWLRRSFLDDLRGDASDPAVDGGFRIAATGYIGCDGIGERAGKRCCSGLSQRTGKLTEGGDAGAKVSG